MPGRGIQHVDLAVTDVDRSLAFYVDLLGPLGLREEERYPTYRGSEEVVYLSLGDEWLGLRPADGGTHRYYGVGLEHLAFEVDTMDEVDAAHGFRIEVFSPGSQWSARIHGASTPASGGEPDACDG